MSIRVGNGFDVHKLGNGNELILCGIRIPHTKTLIGHSDADVAMHAVTDSILGALAEGDIGTHFPPTDLKWKHANSEIFLKKAVFLMKQKYYSIGNLDITIICETPKISTFSLAMKTNIARLCGAEINQISVKGTTTERLGFTGRNEGIASLATVLIKTNE